MFSKTRVNNSVTFLATTESIKCFHCGVLGSRASECFLHAQDKGKINLCYRCEEIGQTFKQYEKRNQSLRGGTSPYSYKVGCALSVKKLNTIKFS